MTLMFAAAAAVVPGTSSAARAADDCDRDCMTSALDRYLATMVLHEPRLAPVTTDLRSTENGHEVKVGEGLWRSLNGLGEVGRRYVDTASGQAAFLGTITEGGGQALLSLRVKFHGAKIAESEAIVARKGELLYNPAGLVIDAPRPARIDDTVQPSSREALIATAGAYFDALGGNQAPVPKIDGCERLENGTNVTRRMPSRPAGAVAEEAVHGDCTTGITTMPIKAVAHRRFVADTESGVVLGIGLFQRPPGAVWRDGSPRKRNLIHEYFIQDGGKIAQIVAVMHYIEPTDPDSTGW